VFYLFGACHLTPCSHPSSFSHHRNIWMYKEYKLWCCSQLNCVLSLSSRFST
jgi:hypothetical protein